MKTLDPSLHAQHKKANNQPTNNDKASQAIKDARDVLMKLHAAQACLNDAIPKVSPDQRRRLLDISNRLHFQITILELGKGSAAANEGDGGE